VHRSYTVRYTVKQAVTYTYISSSYTNIDRYKSSIWIRLIHNSLQNSYKRLALQSLILSIADKGNILLPILRTNIPLLSLSCVASYIHGLLLIFYCLCSYLEITYLFILLITIYRYLTYLSRLLLITILYRDYLLLMNN